MTYKIFVNMNVLIFFYTEFIYTCVGHLSNHMYACKLCVYYSFTLTVGNCISFSFFWLKCSIKQHFLVFSFLFVFLKSATYKNEPI